MSWKMLITKSEKGENMSIILIEGILLLALIGIAVVIIFDRRLL